jgi:hypothetical protein
MDKTMNGNTNTDDLMMDDLNTEVVLPVTQFVLDGSDDADADDDIDVENGWQLQRHQRKKLKRSFRITSPYVKDYRDGTRKRKQPDEKIDYRAKAKEMIPVWQQLNSICGRPEHTARQQQLVSAFFK